MFTELPVPGAETVIPIFEKKQPPLGNQPPVLERDILESLYYVQGKTKNLATLHDWYMAVAFAVRCRLMNNWIDTLHNLHEKKDKIVGYLSAEFLMGPHLGNALINLGVMNEFDQATRN